MTSLRSFNIETPPNAGFVYAVRNFLECKQAAKTSAAFVRRIPERSAMGRDSSVSQKRAALPPSGAMFQFRLPERSQNELA
jgi:hypothetical protein